MLLAMGVALGICLGSKLYIPVVACVLGAGFVAYDVWQWVRSGAVGGTGTAPIHIARRACSAQ